MHKPDLRPLGPLVWSFPWHFEPDNYRTVDVHPSIIYQIDALMAKLIGNQKRPDVDLFAPSDALAFCKPYSWRPFDDLASYNGLYFNDPERMSEAVAAAWAASAFGIFIVPVWIGEEPLVERPRTKSGKLRHAKPWFDLLMDDNYFVLAFPFSSNAISREGEPWPVHEQFMGVVADFGKNGRVCKKYRRPERFVPIKIIPGWPACRRLGVAPEMWTMPSPLPPTPVEDTFKGSTLFPPPPPGAPPVAPSKSAWDCPSFAKLLSDYPYPGVSDIALRAMRGELDPYEGRRDVAKDCPERVLPAAVKSQCRAKMASEAAKGNMDGPRPYVPFENASILPFGAAKKFKYAKEGSEESKIVRLTSDFSSNDHGGPSGNELCWSPR